ncbi:hypothetical protein BDN72DRAFT_762517 [Pluteus cervinus]|uniref:Uncharacterized protein n=1 Tax=Pluteus cervinus TaxID=181527 RepID=A0ACD3B522_9AGAR|nr:hypothetical protein BDN72DRAFT_762517 [Pluteus cervinus]
MQKECAILVQMMARELEQLRLQAQHIVQKMNSQKPLGPSKKQADLSDPARWGHGDAVYFGTLLRSYEEDLIKLKAQHEHSRSCLKELRSGMLKAGTRKEEISRFKKANSDQEFSKMLKSRTLGPEHLETQIQLRRKIRASQAMRDRIQQLEDHLNSSKKRINEVNSARPSMKAPSFDTVNRTYRNIDIAIQQQSTDVSKLSARLSKLDLTSRPNRSERDPRLPDRVIKQPYHVTPHVATTTAAALNAERSAHKLKRALLKVRMEPLMNTTAATAPPPPVTFNTPKKPDSSSQVEGLDSPEWSLPEDQFNPSTPVPTRRGAGTGTKRHQSVPLRRGPASTPSPNPSSFDWGPLPQFSAQPAATMIRNVQLVPIGPTTPPPSRLPTGFVPLTKKS